MADVRPFRGLRYNAAKVAPAAAIAPPYDVISPEQQRALYERSPDNIVRVEYGEQRGSDNADENRYSRAARDLAAWKNEGVLLRDERPAIYSYRQRFERENKSYTRAANFAAVRLEAWDKGVIKPHERTLSGPKQDRLELLRATRTQVSPVYSLFRAGDGSPQLPDLRGEPVYDFESDGERHVVSIVSDRATVEAFHAHLADSGVYIADGHHRYETALAYRDECRARASSWSGEEPENFVLMALSDAADPGLLVLPTHRIVLPPSGPGDALDGITRHFEVAPYAGDLESAVRELAAARAGETRFAAVGLGQGGQIHILTLRDRAGVEALMPEDESPAWKQLDVNVLQYGILRPVLGIDDDVLAAGGAIRYTQDAHIAAIAGNGEISFLLNPTPVQQVLAVADAGGRMPQKSTYFYPKLPTGLVMNPLDA